MVKVTVEWLQTIAVLQGVPADQLQWLLDNSEDKVYKAGEFLAVPGDTVDCTYVLIDGRLRVYYVQNDEAREVGIFESRAISGYLPFSKGKISGVYLQAISNLQILSLPVQNPPSLICTKFELTNALVGVMIDRVRTFTALQRKNEKILAIGKLSAGLASELDLPSSAVLAGTAMLKKHLRMMPESFKKYVHINLDPEVLLHVKRKIDEILNREKCSFIDSVEREQSINAMATWLEQQDIACESLVAQNLTINGFTIPDAEELRLFIPEKFIAAAFNWIDTTLTTETMLGAIKDNSNQIAKLVGSVKKFTHMDRGNAKQFADIHDGICNTLTMLRHKIHKNRIKVVENFDLNLPIVKAMIAELNQVWTNLIDNALDAMENMENGILEIRTSKDGDDVVISIIDNGPGINEENIDKIFDPFFTTKQIGKGSGLGLELVNRIVNQHSGTITAKSEPGSTEFVVCFPING